MKTASWPKRIGFSALTAALLIVPACSQDGHITFLGYSSKPLFDPTIKTVCVAMIKNYTPTLEHGSVEFDITMAIIDEIHLRTPYRCVRSRTAADTELLVTFKKDEKNVINMNQLNENREAQITLTFEVHWIDHRPGHEGDVLSAPKRRPDELPPPLGPDGKEKLPPPVLITPTTTYQPELGGTRASTLAQLEKILATQVVNMMERSGTGW